MNLDSDLGERNSQISSITRRNSFGERNRMSICKKVVRAARELFRAAKNWTSHVNSRLFYACLAVAAVEWGWNGNGG